MKNNTLLLLSLLCCAQFVGAMEDRSGYGSCSGSEDDRGYGSSSGSEDDHGDNNYVPQRLLHGMEKIKAPEMRRRCRRLGRQKPPVRQVKISFNMPEAARAYALTHPETHPTPVNIITPAPIFVPQNGNVRRNLFQEFN